MDFQNKSENEFHYRSETPPSYNLSNVVHPITLHYSDGDYLVTKDVRHSTPFICFTYSAYAHSEFCQSLSKASGKSQMVFNLRNVT